MARTPVKPGMGQDVAAFLETAAKLPARPSSGPRGRLIFAMDATASRGPTWGQAMALQAEMFSEAASLGGLDVQLVYYRGLGEFRASPWTANADAMVRYMTGVSFLAGQTQIGRVLGHALTESQRMKVNALVFIGDAVEEEPEALYRTAGELGLKGVPVFMFQEGGMEPAASVFRRIAKLSGGAYGPFDGSSPQALRDLLRAVAVFAAGGRQALQDYGRKQGGAVLRLTDQMSGG